MKDDECMPILISLSMMPDLFGVGLQTAHRWNTLTAREGSRLPPPDLILARVPYWYETTLREWAQSRTNPLVWDEEAFTAICQTQLLG